MDASVLIKISRKSFLGLDCVALGAFFGEHGFFDWDTWMGWDCIVLGRVEKNIYLSTFVSCTTT